VKGKIDKAGILFIERGKRMAVQNCPFKECRCGDWCPLFSEPRQVALDTLYQSDKKVEAILIICHGRTLVFDHFTDERERV